MTAPGESPRFDWPLICVLCAIATLNYCDRTAITAVFPLLRRDLGMSDVALASTGSFFLWSYALCSPVTGWLADRTSRSRVILASLTLWSLTAIAMGLAHTTKQLLSTRIVLGIVESAYIPAAVGLLGQRHASERRGTAIGLHTAALGLGTVTGATIAGFLGERYGWRLSFHLLGAAGLVLAALAWPILRPGPGRNPVRTEPSVPLINALLYLARIPSYWILLAQSMVASVGVWMFINWLPLYLKETFLLSLALAGFSGAALVDFPGTFGVVLGGAISDRLARRGGQRRMMLQSICYTLAAPLLLAFFAKPVLALTFAAVFAFFLLRAIALSNENPLLCDLIASPYRSMAVGLMHAANCAAGGAGILAAALLKKDYGLNGAFASVSVLTVLVAALTFIGYRFTLPQDLSRSAIEQEYLPLQTSANL